MGEKGGRQVARLAAWPLQHLLGLLQPNPAAQLREFASAIERALCWFDGMEREFPSDQRVPRTQCAVMFADNSGQPVFPTFWCGVIEDPLRAQNSGGFVIEKGHRLGQHPEHVAASQSENVLLKQFGRGIRLDGGATFLGGRLILLSGLRGGFADEAAILLACVACGLMTKDRADEIARETGNPHWGRLYAFYRLMR